MPIIPERREQDRNGENPGVSSPTLPIDPAARYEAARDNGARNQARLLMQEAMTAHGNFRKENPDEEAWGNDLKEREASVLQALDTERMSPTVKAELGAEFEWWQRRNAETLATDASRHGVTRARQRATTLIDAYTRAGDFTSAGAVLTQSRGREFTDDEVAGRLEEVNRAAELHAARMADDAVRREIEMDPDGWLDRHPAEAAPDGVDAAVHLSRRMLALERKGMRMLEMQEVVGAGIAAGKIRSAAEIDHYAEDALPKVKDFFKAELTARNDPAEVTRRKSGIYQDRIVGEIAEDILELKPDGLEERLLLGARIGALPEGPVKESFRGMLLAKSSGNTAEDDSPLSRSLGSVAEIFRGGLLGTRTAGSEEMTSGSVSAVDGYGKISREMIRWTAANPEADEETTRRKLRETVKPELMRAWSRRAFGTDEDYFTI